MRIAICDDDRGFHILIERLLLQYEIKRGINIYTTHFESGEALPVSKEFDIVFMDYEMSGINGIETAKKLREAKSDTTIIFISAYPEAALDSFEVSTFRFLKKPVDRDKLFKALDDYLSSFNHNSIIKINTNDGEFTIKISDIVYLEGDQGHTTVRTVNNFFYISGNIKQIEIKLPKDLFVRCHKTFVAGLAHIKNHNTTEINFDNGEKAKIGRHYAKNFKESMQNYILKYNEGHYQ